MTLSIICAIVVGVVFGIGFLLFGQTAGLAQRLGNDPLQLTVGGTELVGCPFFNGIHRVAIDTQDETLCGFLCPSLLGRGVFCSFGLESRREKSPLNSKL